MTQFKIWTKNLNSHFSKEDTQKVIRYMKRCLTSLVIREKQIKTIMGYKYIPIRQSKIKNLTIPNIAKNVEQLEFSYIPGGTAN